MDQVRACVVGATGFAGVELCRHITVHPGMELCMATDRSAAGSKLSDLYPALVGVCDIVLEQPDPTVIAKKADIAFLAVPHTAALDMAPGLLEAGVTVVDLSADYRISDPAVYEAWYEVEHTSPELLAQTVYGLPELNRAGLEALAAKRAAGQAVLVAAPGCYPTATALAAIPALEAGFVTGSKVIVDAISGISGAGRKPSARTHYCHGDESVEAYGVASHRHTPEIEQTLSQAAGRDVSVVFTPHLAPLSRGLLSTVYLDVDPAVTAEQVQAAYQERYADEALVAVLPAGQMPATGSVSGTGRAQVGVALDTRTHTVIATCAIDNLGKGAAAQAVQCANIVLGFAETAALDVCAPVV